MGRIARRGPMAIPLVDKERVEKFQHLTEGSTVEVSSDEPGFEGAWYQAKIVRSNSNRNGKLLIQYQKLVSEDDPGKLLTENAYASFIRPVPPPTEAAQTYEPGDVVDAFHRDGWWKGVVIGIDGLKGTSKSRRKYTVTFENPNEQFKFSSADMRFHWVRIHGKWVRHPKHKEVQDYREVRSSANKSRKNPFQQSTPLSSTSIGKKQKVSVPETEESMPSCSNGFRMETSTNFGSPVESHTTSPLGNSVEHIKDSTLTKCSVYDTCADSQLTGSNSFQKGKTSIPPSRKQSEEQSVDVPNKVSSRIDNRGEMRTNPLEKPISFSSASATKKRKMPTPETIVVKGTRGTKAQGRLARPMVRRKWRKRPKVALFPALSYNLQREEQSAQIPNEGSVNADNPCEDSPLQDASSKLQPPGPEIEKTLPTCSIKDRSVPLSANTNLHAGRNPQSGEPICPSEGKNLSQTNRKPGMTESSEKRETELTAQLTNEHPADIINEECVENGFESSAANVQSESELLRNEDLPFKKSSYLWKHFDSLEVFKVLPQRPHFSPLLDCNDETCEGTAIGHMLTFISMVEKVSRLKIDDPRSLFDSYSEALDILELLGFDVKKVADRAKELLSLKTNHERVDDQSKKLLCDTAESDRRKVKLEQEISEIDQKIRELEEQRAAKESKKVKEYSASESLQRNVSNLKDYMLALEYKFKVKVGAPW